MTEISNFGGFRSLGLKVQGVAGFLPIDPRYRCRCLPHGLPVPSLITPSYSPNGNRISKLITAVYKANRQDETRNPPTENATEKQSVVSRG